MTSNHSGDPDLAHPEHGGLRKRVIARLEERGNYSTWVLLAALAGMFTSTFPITILVVSLGAIAREFDASETTVAWVIAGPMLLSAVALPLLGKLGDLYGHRRIFLAGYAAGPGVFVDVGALADLQRNALAHPAEVVL